MQIPVLKALKKLGTDIKDARLRRRLPAELMAQRADISLGTLSKIEKGEGTVAMGSYATVLFVLGMTERLEDLVDSRHDVSGRAMEDERLPKRVRLPGTKQGGGDE